MDVITAYLETMFSPYPETPRLSEAKAELREMMEDAYHAAIAAGRSENEAVGQVITEFGNLDELAPILGIASELNPDTVYGNSATANGAASATPPAHPPVTIDEARGFAEATRRTHPVLAIAVAIFVLSPTALVAFSLGAPSGTDRGTSVFLGIVILMIMVAIGVGLIVLIGRQLNPYARIREGRFTPDPAVTAWATKQRDRHETRRAASIAIAVTLFILAALPPIASGLLDNAVGANLQVWGVPLTLLIVAIGLLVLIPATWAESVRDRLAKGGPKVASEDDDERASYPAAVRVLLAIWWPITLVAYLTWSFVEGAWHISWIVWPIAGILFWGIGATGDALKKTD